MRDDCGEEFPFYFVSSGKVDRSISVLGETKKREEGRAFREFACAHGSRQHEHVLAPFRLRVEVGDAPSPTAPQPPETTAPRCLRKRGREKARRLEGTASSHLISGPQKRRTETTQTNL